MTLSILIKMAAVGCDLSRVFEIGPVFRAENSNTHRKFHYPV